ncbi:MAG: Anaerobic nitric oxide reductase transcription regulator NorR [Planctomycetes bacterium]|nr:Anaerobic nitric oxide reductase transcription regulator NorR [Planctomycetota bacterium]
MKHPPPWTDALAPAELLDLLTDGVCAVDADGRVVVWNRAAEEITGHPASETLGRPPDFLEGVGCEGFRKLGELATGRRKGPSEMRGMECRVLVRDGRVARLVGNARAVTDAAGRRRGAVACFMDATALHAAIERAEALGGDLDAERGFGRMVGRSPAMRELARKIRVAAASDVTVVLLGETGTGKDLAARTIHDAGPRAAGPFVAVNCSAIPETLLESELFGHAKGAFTGAVADAPGRFELADGGTLFLDEVGEISPLVQVKLLRALESREIERIGDGRTRRVDVRLVAATHRDLASLVAEGRMREDFYYRLRVFPLRLPPLRDRREDIPALAAHLLDQLRERSRRAPSGFTRDAMRALADAPWPGNVRQLRNAVEYAAAVAEGPRIDAGDLPPDLAGAGPALAAPSAAPSSRTRDELLANEAARALAATGGRVSDAAARLGISRVTLWRRLGRRGRA